MKTDPPGAVPVRLAGPPELTGKCVLPALAPLVAGGLRLEVRIGRPAERLLAEMEEGRHDVLLCTIDPLPGKLEFTRLPDEEFVLVAAPAWTEGPGDVLEAPLIATSPRLPLIGTYWRRVLGREPAAPAVTAADLRAVLELVEAGAGISVLPRYLCKQALGRGTLVDPVRPDNPPTNPLFVVTSAGCGPEPGRVRAAIISSAQHWNSG